MSELEPQPNQQKRQRISSLDELIKLIKAVQPLTPEEEKLLLGPDFTERVWKRVKERIHEEDQKPS